jgi:hypothetical protein
MLSNINSFPAHSSPAFNSGHSEINLDHLSTIVARQNNDLKEIKTQIRNHHSRDIASLEQFSRNTIESLTSPNFTFLLRQLALIIKKLQNTLWEDKAVAILSQLNLAFESANKTQEGGNDAWWKSAIQFGCTVVGGAYYKHQANNSNENPLNVISHLVTQVSSLIASLTYDYSIAKKQAHGKAFDACAQVQHLALEQISKTLDALSQFIHELIATKKEVAASQYQTASAIVRHM